MAERRESRIGGERENDGGLKTDYTMWDDKDDDGGG